MSATINVQLGGKVCVVTGANSGIGKSIATALAKLGGHVVMACRDAAKAEPVRAEIAAAAGPNSVEVATLDLASQQSVRDFATAITRKHPKIDVLVNNAGAWWLDRRESPDGVELQWATNVLGPFLLTRLLTPALQASGHGRIVTVASTAAGGMDLNDLEFKTRKYSGISVYSQAKQANRVMSWGLADQLTGKNVTINAMSPGFIATGLNRNVTGIFKFFFALAKPMQKTPEQGADTAVWLAASPDVEGVTNKFFVGRTEKPCKFRIAPDIEKLNAALDARIAEIEKRPTAKSA